MCQAGELRTSGCWVSGVLEAHGHASAIGLDHDSHEIRARRSRPRPNHRSVKPTNDADGRIFSGGSRQCERAVARECRDVDGELARLVRPWCESRPVCRVDCGAVRTLASIGGTPADGLRGFGWTLTAAPGLDRVIRPLALQGRVEGSPVVSRRSQARLYSRFSTLTTEIRAAQRAGRLAPNTATSTPASATTPNCRGLIGPSSVELVKVKLDKRAAASKRLS